LAAGKDVAYTYTTPGTYTAEMTVSDGHGGIDTATVAVTVSQASDTTAPTTTDPTPGDSAGNAVTRAWSFVVLR
jgi:PKD repeat protein